MSLINLQDELHIRIKKACTNFRKSPKDRITKEYLESRLEALEVLWSDFTSGHKKILCTIEYNELQATTYMKDDLYDATDEVYIEYKTMLKKLLGKYNNINVDPSNCGAVAKQSHVKLPQINIPTFTGNYSEWPTFRDLFKSLIHNNEALDKVEKLHYLKGYLTGEAEIILRHIPISESNYDRCWSMLESRYNNKRFLSHSILKRMLSQRNCTFESVNGIKELIDTTSECLEALKGLGIDVHSWDIIVIHIITLKLDPETRRQWEFNVTDNVSTDNLPTFKQFKEFLTNRFRALEFLDSKSKNVRNIPHTFHITDDREIMNNEDLSVNAVITVTCSFCKGNHKMYNCEKYKTLDCDVRRSFAQRSAICFICLRSNHTAKYCRTDIKCRICKRRHNTLLHPKGLTMLNENVGERNTSQEIMKEVQPGASMSTKAAEEAEEEQKMVATCLSTGRSETVLLATAVIKAESKTGSYQMIRALVDQGSQASLITEATVQQLGLKKIPSKSVIRGVGGEKSTTATSIVKIKIRSRIDPLFEMEVIAYVLKSITMFLPAVKVTTENWISVKTSCLADPDYNTPNKIDILLGADVYCKIIQEGVKKNTTGSLLAQSTVFGWVISGIANTSEDFSINVVVMHTHIDSDELLKKFWELEAEPANKKKMLTEEEKQCESYFATTTTRTEDGRYVVRLPFRDSNPASQYGNSRKIAEKRLYALENKLRKNLKLKDCYKEVLNEYQEFRHMIPATSEKKEKVFLPHHAVVREDKDTTKVRVVYDASCKGENGVSLNDDLLVGPSLQDDLRHILIRWREFPVCIVADIEKMYRQVNVHEDDQSYQQILWRENPEEPIKEYKLTTVTFGTASAPFLAVRALQQVAKDEGAGYPLAAGRVLSDFYMDDLMTGAANEAEASKIYKQMSELLSKGGFKLQKWSSNSEELLRSIKSEGESKKLHVKQDAIIKILGLTWDRSNDEFYYSVSLPLWEKPATKRNILSDISRLYDPLGWIAPSIILAKIFIQKIWLAGVGWDEEIPEKLLKEWLTYRSELEALTKVRLPRWFHTDPLILKKELHGFCDASKFAYSAVIYLRTVDRHGNTHVSIVASKTRVAPIKQVSIPRLELCGATLLARLMIEISEVMQIEKKDLFAWTDSEIVIAWLNNHPSRWQTFVANRVSEILSTLDTHRWAHVQSSKNPADCASRGISPSKLHNTAMWFEGPKFLYENPIVFPKHKNVTTTLEEIKSHNILVEPDPWEKYSSLMKLLRVMAFCKRFINNCKNSSETVKLKLNYLTTDELNEAMICCIKRCQEEEFKMEIDNLKKKVFTKKDKLKSFNAFIDEDGLLRVGGRLEESSLCFNRKHPILIPKRSYLTKLLVLDAHTKTLHAGPQLMLNYLHSKYWIIGAKLLVKECIRKCTTCVRYKAVTKSQLMGQVPSVRVTINKPFYQTGVDYAGPIDIRTTKGRGHHAYKGYICLFICMATRAVHLEAVSDLTSQGFLAAFKRFVARRGHCAALYSDNGTNFVGAARELTQLLQSEKSTVVTEIADWLSTNGTKWHFIPPHAPNFGGLWEAGIKSTKHHLKRVMGNLTLTYEEISTVLAQIEACLNSRPLSKLQGDSQESMALTPGHFLVGEPLMLVPEVNYEDSNVTNLRRWQLTQKIVQDFWRRWSKEYLQQFLQRNKWVNQNPEPKVGDVVLIKEDDLPPCRWLMGKVEQKHPGPDNLTRVVTIKTKGATLKRPTSKLLVLPVTE